MRQLLLTYGRVVRLAKAIQCHPDVSEFEWRLERVDTRYRWALTVAQFTLPVDRLRANSPSNKALGVRSFPHYSMALEFLRKGECDPKGYLHYLTHEHWMSPTQAQQRLTEYMMLLASTDRPPPVVVSQVLPNQEFEILDGLHRSAIAMARSDLSGQALPIRVRLFAKWL